MLLIKHTNLSGNFNCFADGFAEGIMHKLINRGIAFDSMLI